MDWAKPGTECCPREIDDRSLIIVQEGRSVVSDVASVVVSVYANGQYRLVKVKSSAGRAVWFE